jgi:hypothetical protein
MIPSRIALVGGVLAAGLSVAAGFAGTANASTVQPAKVKLGNGSVILDSGKNFTEPNGSEATAGPGCRTLSQPKLASSIVVTGGPIQLFSGKKCTGSSVVIKGSVADLGKIGFDKKTVSILFGR